MQNIKTVGQRIIKLFGGQPFLIQGPLTLTSDLVTSNQ
jgi:hypothetical protein